METTKTFQELGVSEEILRALEKKGVAMPTRVQEEAIPPLLAWRDVIAKAPTGTGKTFAFGIPMIEHIDPQSDDLQGLILAPTRELAIQIADELRGLLTFYKDIRVTVVYGGQRLEPQIRSLQQHPQIVVATPGRLMDHYNRKNLRLDTHQDRHSRRGGSHAGHGLLRRCDENSRPASRTVRTSACSPRRSRRRS